MSGERDNQGPSWVQRNWRWVFPAALVGVVALAAGLSLLVLTIIMHPSKSSEVYRQALQRASSDPRVLERLGEPVEPRWFVTGRVERTGPRGGLADMTIPLAGPRGEANLYVIGREHEGRWVVTKLILEPGTEGERIDLLERP